MVDALQLHGESDNSLQFVKITTVLGGRGFGLHIAPLPAIVIVGKHIK